MSAALRAPCLAEAVRHDGFARLRPVATRAHLNLDGPTLATFAESWQRLEPDGFMADGGRYRRRRLANFTVLPNEALHHRGLHAAHFQPRKNNGLNGGMDRWFAPVEDDIAAHPATRALLALGHDVAEALRPGCGFFAEMHQFRIEATPDAPGHPTPEGAHQDGVDCVLIALLARTNLRGGETLVAEADGRERARFTLEGMLDLVVLNDRRLRHGVTPVEAVDPSRPSSRDVLVLTWKAV